MQCTQGFSGRIGKTVVLFLLLPFLPLNAEDVSPLDQDLPPWLLLEKGKNYFLEKDFSTSLNYLQYAQQKGAVFPEVEYWIGRIYEEEGEFLLAEEQYLKAYQQKKYLYISDQQYEIAYRLSRIYLNSQRWSDYENILMEIVHQELQKDLSQVEQEHQIVRVLKEQSLDDLIYLYRKNFSFSIRAFRELSVFYYKNGNYRSSTINSLYVMLGQVSAVIEGILETDPQFQYPRNLEQLIHWDPLYVAEDIEHRIQLFDRGFSFARQKGSEEILNQEQSIIEGLDILEKKGKPYPFSGLSYMLFKARQNRGIITYLEEGLFFQNIYYLAASLYGEGYEDQALNIWYWLAETPDAGQWKKQAAAKIEDPRAEDLDFIF